MLEVRDEPRLTALVKSVAVPTVLNFPNLRTSTVNNPFLFFFPEFFNNLNGLSGGFVDGGYFGDRGGEIPGLTGGLILGERPLLIPGLTGGLSVGEIGGLIEGDERGLTGLEGDKEGDEKDGELDVALPGLMPAVVLKIVGGEGLGVGELDGCGSPLIPKPPRIAGEGFMKEGTLLVPPTALLGIGFITPVIFSIA